MVDLTRVLRQSCFWQFLSESLHEKLCFILGTCQKKGRGVGGGGNLKVGFGNLKFGFGNEVTHSCNESEIC